MILDILKLENSLMSHDPERYPEEVVDSHVAYNTPIEITVPNGFTYTRKLMCLTLSGLPVPIITITSSRANPRKLLK
jgi:hypothetical protein